VEHSSGNKFYLEITSIAENEWSFKKKTSEKRFKDLSQQQKIRIRDLKKIAAKFDSLERYM